MSVVYLHGLGQTPASWAAVLRVLGQESGGLCPDLFGLIRGKEVCYENLYQGMLVMMTVSGPLSESSCR